MAFPHLRSPHNGTVHQHLPYLSRLSVSIGTDGKTERNTDGHNRRTGGRDTTRRTGFGYVLPSITAPFWAANQAQIKRKSMQIACDRFSMFFGPVLCTDLRLICTLQIATNQALSIFTKHSKTHPNHRKSQAFMNWTVPVKKFVLLYLFRI